MPANRLPVPVPSGGENIHEAPWTIGEEFSPFLQDVLLDQIGYARRRGAMVVAAPPASTYPVPGIFQAINPQGGHRVAELQSDNSGNTLFTMISSSYLTVSASYTWPWAFDKKLITAPSNNLKRGTWIGASKRYDNQSSAQALALWRGGIGATGSGGATMTATRGSKTVTMSGSTTAGVDTGMFVFAAASDVSGTPTTLIGVIQSKSGSTITLEEPALASVAGGTTASFTALRGVNPRYAEGSITCATSSATVNGGGTHFKGAGLGAIWRLFRARDLVYIGDVSSVTSDIQLTLGASAAIAMDNEQYIAIKMDGNFDVSIESSNWDRKLGFLTAVYGGRQFYANTRKTGDTSNYAYRLWYSSPLDPEAVNLDDIDGDHLIIPSTGGFNYPVIGLFGSYNGLCIYKQNEVFLLTGDDPTNFSIRNLLSTDGLIAPMTILPHEGGCIWAGSRGVYLFDGVDVVDVSQNLGFGYQTALNGRNPETSRAYAAKHRNHYVLAIEDTTPPPDAVPCDNPALTGDVGDDPALSDTSVAAFDVITCDTGDWELAVSFTYQWQKSADGVTDWIDIPGETTNTFTIPVLDLPYDDFRCVVTAINSCGETTAPSNVAHVAGE